MSVNHFVGIGRLTRDPEYKKTPTDKSVALFTLAINERFGGGSRDAVFLDVECWNQLAEVVNEHLHKGRMVCVQGRIKQERWETKEGKRSRLLVSARSVEFLDAPVTFNPDELEREREV